MSKRTRASALKSGYATGISVTQSSLAPPPVKRRKRRSAPSSPILSPRRHDNHTIDDARISKQTAIPEGLLSSTISCPRPTILRLPDDVLYHMISFMVSPKGIDDDAFLALQCSCKRFRELANSAAVWNRIPLTLSDGRLNLSALGYIKQKSQGTEGTCYQVRCRRTERMMALKRARVYPDNEGVPYYMMRELSALKKLNHPNICELETVNLHSYKLYLLFAYTEHTLYDFLSPSDSSQQVALTSSQIRNIMKQVLAAVAYCHERCIMHRNLKPKHLLVVPGPGPDPLDHATVKLADFALVRVLVHPPRKYTTEVITLWYRPPEILLGQRNYSTAVDVWSVGCIFAELLGGKPLFSGVCEIDQLFQIFSRLGTPNEEVWPGCTSLPFYSDPKFPKWEVNLLSDSLRSADAKAISLLSKFLVYAPENRLTAADAINDDYFVDLPTPSPPVSEALVPPPHRRRQSSGLLWEPLFSAGSEKEVNFDLSVFCGIATISPMILRQYLYLRHLEGSEIYNRPYFGRPFPKSDTPVPNNSCGISRSVSYSSLHSNSSVTPPVDSNVTSGDMDVMCVHRMELVDNLISFMDHMSVHMCIRTVFFAVAIFDIYLSADKKPRESLFPEYDLIGCTCLHIASKCEDVSYISVKDLAQASQDIADGSAILQMEEKILNVLNFDLYVPVVIDFVGFFVDCVPEVSRNTKVATFCQYFSELSLLYPCFLTLPASAVGTAIVSYSMICCDLNPWPESLQKLSMYDPVVIVTCVKKLNRMHSRVLQRGMNNTYERYSIMEHEVALLDPPAFNANYELDSMFGIKDSISIS